ncbi:GIY-YIG nuclease family protein [Syntrophomonas wolfei]|uniref:Endonuclease n=1 Tax=Syntrophomonas wolfei TaxID=863 RepID=A0A354YT46_9FIRM|nr:GIY-YIG nuclease family protein [Syntrophomonas wolfei]HBK52359.1 endonuclease [Syntrophomonas wolfei]
MSGEESYYIYILSCSDGTLYTGSTNNLSARLEKHNQGEGARYTRGRRPVTLVYSEFAAGKSAALKRERQIKKMTRAAKLALIK